MINKKLYWSYLKYQGEQLSQKHNVPKSIYLKKAITEYAEYLYNHSLEQNNHYYH